MATNTRGKVRSRRSHFALALIPIFLVLGVAVDYSRATSAKSALQNASDAAALAAGANPAETQAQHLAAGGVQGRGQSRDHGLNGVMPDEFMHAQSGRPLAQHRRERNGRHGRYTVQISAKINTAVMQLANFPNLKLNATSEASVTGVSAAHPLEVALALDNTGSMANNIQALNRRANARRHGDERGRKQRRRARQRRALCRGGQSWPAEPQHDRYDGAVHV